MRFNNPSARNHWNIHFIFSDLFSLFDTEYVQATTYQSATIGGTFMWDQGTGGGQGATNENYNTHLNNFAGIFDNSDQHHFLSFANSPQQILEILGDFFKERIDTNIQISNLF